jgi:hypothetical protein
VKAGHITAIKNPSQGVGLDIKPYGIIGLTRDIENRYILQPSGKIGKFDVGLLDVQTGSYIEPDRVDSNGSTIPGFGLASKTLSVGRVTANIIDYFHQPLTESPQFLNLCQ